MHSGDTVTLTADGQTFELDADWLDVTEEYRAASGEEVAVIEASFGTVLVYE
jgi:valyl-tRNA synthetase